MITSIIIINNNNKVMRLGKSMGKSRSRNPYYHYPLPCTQETNISRISDLSFRTPQSATTLDVTNQIHKYRDMLSGHNDRSIMEFIHSLREISPNKEQRNQGIKDRPVRTFRTLERRSICETQERKRVSDFSPKQRIAEFYNYWTKNRGSATKDIVAFSSQLRSSKYCGDSTRPAFNSYSTKASCFFNPEQQQPSTKCPKLKNSMKQINKQARDSSNDHKTQFRTLDFHQT